MMVKSFTSQATVSIKLRVVLLAKPLSDQTEALHSCLLNTQITSHRASFFLLYDVSREIIDAF